MAQVLIVDDSPTEAHVLKGMLEKNGFEVETAENGTEGIERAKALKPDLILMDVVMPGLNGFQAVQIGRYFGQGQLVRRPGRRRDQSQRKSECNPFHVTPDKHSPGAGKDHPCSGIRISRLPT